MTGTIEQIGAHSEGALIAEHQSDKEGRSNALDNLISGTTQARLSVTVSEVAGSPSNADTTLTKDQFFGNAFFRLTGSPSVDFTVTVPNDGHHVFAVLNETGRTATVSLGLSATVDVPDGGSFLLHSDGGNIRPIDPVVGQPYDIAAGFEQLPDDGAVFHRVPIPRAILIPADFAGSFGRALPNPNDAYVIDVQADGTSIGTVTVSTSGSFAFATTGGAPQSVASGSVITFVAPAGSPSETQIETLSLGIRATLRLDNTDYLSFDSVKLLLHFEGSDGATSTADESNTGHTAFFNDQAEIDTAQFKAGASSLILTGFETDAVSFSDHADFTLGDIEGLDWTFECHVRLDALSISQANVVFSQYSTGANGRSYNFQVRDDGGGNTILRFAGSSDGTNVDLTVDSSSLTIADDTWYHVAVSNKAGTVRIFLDGVKVAESNAAPFTFFDSSNSFRIGRLDASNDLPLGNGNPAWLDNFRYGHEAIYTANFTPPPGPFPVS